MRLQAPAQGSPDARSTEIARSAEPGGHSGRDRALRAAGVWGVLLVSVVFPLVVTNPTSTSIAVFTLVFIASASAWNAFSGYSGYISLGTGVFFGCGAYTLAIVAQDLHMQGGYSVFALVPLGGVVAAIAAIPVGWIALRTRKHTFIVITIALFFIFQLLAFNLGLTQGALGIATPTPSWNAATYNDRFYYVALAIAIFAVFVSWVIRRSRYGLQLLAIRDDEDRALSLGVRVGSVKLSAVVISAVPIGMAGALYAYFLGQVYPQFAFDPTFDLTLALMVFLGGAGTVSGPILGALLVEPAQQYFTFGFASGGLFFVVYGVLFLVVILFLRRGLIPTGRDLLALFRVRRHRRASVTVAVTGGGDPGDRGDAAASAFASEGSLGAGEEQ